MSHSRERETEPICKHCGHSAIEHNYPDRCKQCINGKCTPLTLRNENGEILLGLAFVNGR